VKVKRKDKAAGDLKLDPPPNWIVTPHQLFSFEKGMEQIVP
jgi:hypothetical protein